MSFAIPRYREPDFTALGLDGAPDVKLVPAERDGVMPCGYHATTLFPEYYHIGGRWVLAEDSRMDCGAGRGGIHRRVPERQGGGVGGGRPDRRRL